MRTFTKLFFAGMLILLFSSLNAQHRGHGHRSVHVPNEVYSITSYYPGYRWVSVDRYSHPRRSLYEVTLQRGNRFVDLRVNRFGRVISKRVYRAHPRHRRGNVKVTEYWSGGPRNRYWNVYTDRDYNRNRNRNRRVPPSERYNYRSN